MPSTSLAKELRDRGMRLTPQRKQVLAAVRDLGHSTPEQIAERARVDGEQLSLTTVYRALDLLEELGLVRHSHIGHGAPTYHAGEDTDHVHVRCHQCGAVESVGAELLAKVADQLLRGRGFRLDPNHVALSGVCAQCATSDDRPNTET